MTDVERIPKEIKNEVLVGQLFVNESLVGTLDIPVPPPGKTETKENESSDKTQK